MTRVGCDYDAQFVHIYFLALRALFLNVIKKNEIVGDISLEKKGLIYTLRFDNIYLSHL